MLHALWEQQCLRISPSGEVWVQIPPQAARFLASLARSPTTLDLSPFIADGTLILSLLLQGRTAGLWKGLFI
jgi:hypothetical protein